MAESKFKLGFDNKEFIKGLKESEKAIDKFVNNVQNKIKKSGGNKGLMGAAAVGGAVAGLTMQGIGMAANFLKDKAGEVLDLDRELVRFRIDAGLSASQTEAFKGKVLSMGIATGTSADEMMRLSKGLYSTSRDFNFVNDNLATSNKLMKATGADANTTGEFVGKLRKEFGLTGDTLEKFIDTTFTIGQSKAVEKNMRQLIEGGGTELIETTKNIYGDKATAKDLQEVFATTMFGLDPNVVRKVTRKFNTDPKIMREFKAMGLNPAKEMGKGIVDVLVDVIGKSDQWPQASNFILGQLAGGKNIEGVMKLKNNLGEVKDLMAAVNKGVGGALNPAANTAINSMSSSMQKLSTAMTSAADSALAPVMDSISKDINDMDPDYIKSLADAFGGLAKVFLLSAEGLGRLASVWEGMNEGLANWLFGTTSNADDMIKGNEFKTQQQELINGEVIKAGEAKKRGDIQTYKSYLIGIKARQSMLNSQFGTLMNDPHGEDKLEAAQTNAMHGWVSRGMPESEVPQVTVKATLNVDSHGVAVATHKTNTEYKPANVGKQHEMGEKDPLAGYAH